MLHNRLSHIPSDCGSTLWFNIQGLAGAGEMLHTMVNLQQNKAACVFLGGANPYRALSSSSVPKFNEGQSSFLTLLKFHHSHPLSGLSLWASLERALWKTASWSTRRLDPVASAWEQECSRGWKDQSWLVFPKFLLQELLQGHPLASSESGWSRDPESRTAVTWQKQGRD